MASIRCFILFLFFNQPVFLNDTFLEDVLTSGEALKHEESEKEMIDFLDLRHLKDFTITAQEKVGLKFETQVSLFFFTLAMLHERNIG